MVTGAPVGSLPAPARGGEVVVARGRAVVLVEVAPETPVSPPSPQPPHAAAQGQRRQGKGGDGPATGLT
jgi:hypothetical protein